MAESKRVKTSTKTTSSVSATEQPASNSMTSPPLLDAMHGQLDLAFSASTKIGDRASRLATISASLITVSFAGLTLLHRVSDLSGLSDARAAIIVAIACNAVAFALSAFTSIVPQKELRPDPERFAEAAKKLNAPIDAQQRAVANTLALQYGRIDSNNSCRVTLLAAAYIMHVVAIVSVTTATVILVCSSTI